MFEFACGYAGSLIANSFLSPSLVHTHMLIDKWKFLFFFFFYYYLSSAFFDCLLGSDHNIYYGVCNIIISS